MAAARIQSTSTHWTGQWQPQETFCKGDGAIGEGKIAEIRFHSVTSKSDITRYTVAVVDVKNAHKVTFNKYGAVVQPNFKTETNSPNKLTHDQLMKVVGRNSGTAVPEKLLDAELLAKLHPKVKGRFELWVDPDRAKSLNLKAGDELLFRTHGDSIFLAQVERTGANKFEGMKGGEMLNQMSKISDARQEEKQVLAQDQLEGVAAAEWDD